VTALAEHQPAAARAQLPRPWQVWLATNLADRIPESTLVEVLVKELGLDHAVAARQVAVYRDAPGVEAARSVADRLHKLESLLEVQHVLARMAREAGDVPRLARLDRDAFLRDHYSRNVPAFAEGWAAVWPALQHWTPAALAQRHGDEMVEVMAARQADPAYEINHHSHRQHVMLRDFVSWCTGNHSNDAYLVANNRLLDRPGMRSLLTDLDPMPDVLDADRLAGNAFLWLGPSGTVTPLHHDVDNVLFVQVYGEKTITLASPMQSHRMYNSTSVYSDVDAKVPDLARHPLFAGVNLMRITVRPGDVLFIPVGWWHQVESTSVSVSVSFVNFIYPNEFAWHLVG
jgi:hypothetical protein